MFVLDPKVKWQDLAMYEQTYAMHTLLQIRWQRTGVTVIEDFIHWNITKKITNNQSHLHMLPPYCLHGAGAEYNTKVILWRRSHCLIHLCTGCYIYCHPPIEEAVLCWEGIWCIIGPPYGAEYCSEGSINTSAYFLAKTSRCCQWKYNKRQKIPQHKTVNPPQKPYSLAEISWGVNHP